MNISELALQNPWWRQPDSIKNDSKIKEHLSAKIKWVPQLITDFNPASGAIYTLRGPRQVGKTTLLKLLIMELLRKGTDPRAVLYLTCDTIQGQADLAASIKQYIEFSNALPKGSMRHIFIDEVTLVPEWTRAIKALVDTGELKDTTVIITGSHSLDLKYSVEQLPGRRGESKGQRPLNKKMLPMDFREYIANTAPELAKELGNILSMSLAERKRIFIGLFNGQIDKMISERLVLYSKDLSHLLDEYLLTGGSIRAIEAYYTDGSIGDHVYELYLRSLLGDLGKWRFRDDLAKQVLRAVIDKMGSRVSLNSIAKENEIGSHNTVSSYLQALEESYVLMSLHSFEMTEKGPNYIRERKVYLSDPFIYHAVRGWIKGAAGYFDLSKGLIFDDELKSQMVEMLVADHLSRWSYDLAPSDVFSPHERLLYWRKKGTGREVDFVFKHLDTIYPIEVKFRRRTKDRDLENMSIFRKGLLLTKDRLDVRDNYSFIPVSMFLLLI